MLLVIGWDQEEQCVMWAALLIVIVVLALLWLFTGGAKVTLRRSGNGVASGFAGMSEEEQIDDNIDGASPSSAAPSAPCLLDLPNDILRIVFYYC